MADLTPPPGNGADFGELGGECGDCCDGGGIVGFLTQWRFMGRGAEVGDGRVLVRLAVRMGVEGRK